ncbi:MAG: ABC transporter permease [Candidatus Dormiibacterota bacterium]
MTAALSATSHVSGRYLMAFARQPYYIVSTLLQPVIWLLLFGHAFQDVVQIPGFASENYISFLTPGVVMMTSLFSNGWSGMGYVLDIERGILDRFLTTPVIRGALISGELIYSALLTALQTVIILALGWVSGAVFHSFLGLVLCIAAALLLGTAFASFSNALALLIRSQQAIIASSFLVLPLAFLSVTFLPRVLLPGWIQTISTYNPVDWAVQVARDGLGQSPDWSYIGLHLGMLALLAVICGWLSTRAFRAYQRSV